MRHLSRLEEQETSANERAETDATWRREQIDYLGGALMTDFLALIPDAPEDYTPYQLSRAAAQAHAVHQFLVALNKHAGLEDRPSVHDIADLVAENNGNLFTGRSLRAWCTTSATTSRARPRTGGCSQPAASTMRPSSRITTTSTRTPRSSRTAKSTPR